MSKVLTGARAVISVDNVVVGIFSSCSYGANIGLEPIFTLGRFGAAEITPTSYEPITVSCNGFRQVGFGPHTLPKFAKLQDLLNLNDITISIRDRQTNKLIMTVTGCKPQSYNTGVNAKATSQISITFLGVKLFDESGDQAESGAVNLP